MRDFLSQVVAHRSGALVLLLLAAFLEAFGDSCFQTSLYRSSGTTRVLWCVAGVLALSSYGVVVNLPRWDFGRLLGAYVVLFFLVAQLLAKLRFQQSPTPAIWLGGALIVMGGIVISAFG